MTTSSNPDFVRTLSPQTLFRLRIQRLADLVAFWPMSSLFFALLRHWLKFRVKDLEATRAFFREAVKDPRPLLICSNHLTYIDSVILIWMFGHPNWYLTRFKKVSWNLPNSKYSKNLFFKFVGYFGKCLFVQRKGAASHIEEILEATKYLLRRGEVFTIFPEGTRSATGRFDTSKLVYGPGKIVKDLEDCRVLCIYLRGDKQVKASSLPPKGSVFDMRARVIEPKSAKVGFEGYQEIVAQIGSTIKDLETEYFCL